MKKNFFVMGILILLFGSVTLAEEIKSTGNVFTITPDINERDINDINNIKLRFCNEGIENDKLTNQLNMVIQPGRRGKICTVLFNGFVNRVVDINVQFTEGEVKSDGTITCSENISEGIFLSMIDTISSFFSLPENSQQIKLYDIDIPKNKSGMVYGCLSYNLHNGYSKSTGAVFGTIVRKVAPIQITVTGDVYNFGRRDDIKYAYTDNKQTILKILIAILAIRLVYTIVQTTKKKEKHHKK